MAAHLELFLQTLISGLLLGGLYGLIGLGMTLIMGVMRIINLAHGELMMVAMYLAYGLFAWFQVDPYLSVFVAAPVLFCLGLGLERFLIEPVVKAESVLPENQVILTVGIGMVLANLATLAFKSDYRSTAVSYSTRAFYLSDFWKTAPIELSISMPWLISAAMALAVTGGLWLFLNRTDWGKAIRATAQNPQAALLMGIDIGRARAVAFGLGAALASAAGCLFMPMYYLHPALGGQFTLIAFVVTVLGGLGSTLGAIWGGLLLGIFESMTAAYLGMGWAPVGRFAVFLVVLILLPGGLASLVRTRGATR